MFTAEVRATFASWIAPEQAHHHEQLAFATGRLAEGVGLVRYVALHEARLPPTVTLDVLDLGAGNGGVALAFANCRRFRVHACDHVPNRVLEGLVRASGCPIRHTVGSGHDLPYRERSFDLVLLVDAIEHVADARQLGREIMRVLKPGGMCLVSTAARLRYVLRPDPHYGVRGLVVLPNELQRFVVDRVARRRVQSEDGTLHTAYDVHHLFWTVAEIGRLFPGAAVVEGLYGQRLSPNASRFSREWWRWKARELLFDHVLVFKAR
jgi:SAM-dependent methyltransferase